MKKAIVIQRLLSLNEILEIKAISQHTPGTEIYSGTSQQLPFPVKVLEQDAEIKRSINFRTMDELLNFGEIKIENKTITDWLTTSNISLWHYHKYRIYFLLRNLSYESALAEDFSSRFETISWYAQSKDIEFLCHAKNVQFSYPVNKTVNSTSYTAMAKYAAFAAYRFLRGVFSLRPKARHILIDRSIKQPCLDIKTLELRKDNYNLAYLFSKAPQGFLIIDEMEVPKFKKGSKFIWHSWMFTNTHKHLKQVTGEYILMRTLLSLRTMKKVKQDEKAIKAILNNLKSQLTSDPDLLMLHYLQQFHGATRFYIFKKFAYQNYFRKNNFLSVSTIDENSPAVKCILDAAKLEKITTFGIQHGNIHDLHPAYRYTKEDRLRKVVPDFTLVWGAYWKNFLSNMAEYSESSLLVTGQSRTDIIPVLQKVQGSLKQKLGLPDSDIVVFASQLQQDPLLRERAAKDVFVMAAEMPETHLVIKLHPSEANDVPYYNEIAASVKCTNFSVVNQMDLYELIASCQLLITCFSTVGTETIYFGKPLIILDHLKQDLQGYIGDKVAFGAYNSADLVRIATEILQGRLTHDMDAYRNYIYERSFKIDGNASQRIIDQIVKNS